MTLREFIMKIKSTVIVKITVNGVLICYTTAGHDLILNKYADYEITRIDMDYYATSGGERVDFIAINLKM